MKSSVLIITSLSVVLGGCGEEGRSLEVRLATSALPRLDPFVSSSLRQVRLSVLGTETNDEVLLDIDLEARSVTFDDLVSDAVTVRVEGLDAADTVVAFGRAAVDLELSDRVEVPFRRNLAYVTHRPEAGQDEPGRSIYALDLATRSLVEEIRLPGTAPVARSLSPRGGESMIVTWRDGAEGQVGLLSLADHTLGTVIRLPSVQDVCVGSEGSPRAVALGGGRISFIDFAAGSATDLGRPIGGRVLDAVASGDGRRALVAVDVAPGLISVDLERREIEAQSFLPDPGAIALDAAGQVAYVTSRTVRQVVAFDLNNRRAITLPGALAAPVDLAVYSEPLRAVVGVNRDGVLGRVIALTVSVDGTVPGRTTPLEGAIETLEEPMGIAADGTGRRFIVVAAGSSTASAGLTIIDSSSNALQGSGRLYPGDPDDTYPISSGSPDREPVLGRQRYRPSSVAVAFGR